MRIYIVIIKKIAFVNFYPVAKAGNKAIVVKFDWFRWAV